MECRLDDLACHRIEGVQNRGESLSRSGGANQRAACCAVDVGPRWRAAEESVMTRAANR